LSTCGSWHETLEEMQADLDAYLVIYNTKRPHRGRNMNGRTPDAVFKTGIPKKAKPATKSGGMSRPGGWHANRTGGAGCQPITIIVHTVRALAPTTERDAIRADRARRNLSWLNSSLSSNLASHRRLTSACPLAS